MATNDIPRLAALIDRHTRADGMHDTAIPSLQLYRCSERSDFVAVIYEPSMCIVAQGAKEVLLEGESYCYNPAQSLLVSVGLPVSARIVEASPSRPCLVARLIFDPAVVGELLADGVNAEPQASLRAMGVSPLDHPTLDAVGRLVGLLDAPRDVAVLAPLVVREITYRILTGPHGGRLRQLTPTGLPAQRIAGAVRWLKDHFADPLRIELLAKRVNMSPSAFHAHFKGVTAMSPLQYQKRLRLHEARRLMLGEALDAAEAAFRVGYESPSQFSREYRRLFGAPPRQDVAAVKTEVQLSS